MTLESTPPLAASPAPPPGRSSWRGAARGAVVVLAALGAWFWWQGAERRALLRLPAAERQAVYQRELANFEKLCTQDPPDSLADECRHRAWMLSWLPECNTGCRTMIGRLIPLHDEPQNPRSTGQP